MRGGNYTKTITFTTNASIYHLVVSQLIIHEVVNFLNMLNAVKLHNIIPGYRRGSGSQGPGPRAHLVVGLLQAGDGVAPHGGVGEGGGEELQGVLHVHGPPLAQQLQGLLGLLGQVPVHTLQELGQGLGEMEE